MKITRVVAAVALIGVIIFVWLVGSSNPVSPAGYVGYLTQGAVFGKTRFYGLQTGPTSPGRTWLLSVTNVSVTPYTYPHEDFSGNTSVLSRDNLKISFSVAPRMEGPAREREGFRREIQRTLRRPAPGPDRADRVRQFPSRSRSARYARDEIQRLNGLEDPRTGSHRSAKPSSKRVFELAREHALPT